MLDFLRNAVLGPNAGLRHSDLAEMSRRDSWSNYLPYVAYDEKTESYHNQDNTVGLLWDCMPVAFIGTKGLTTLEGLFRAGLPMGSVLQLILHADPHIEPILERYQANRRTDHPLVKSSTEQALKFMRDGRKGLVNCNNIPIRNFRLLVSVKIPAKCREAKGDQLLEIKRQISETLGAARLAPQHMPPGRLLEWLRRLINHYPEDYPEHNFNRWDEQIPIRKQIINAETTIEDKGGHLHIGANHFVCVTPKMYPKEVDPLQTNSLFGGLWGVKSDSDQIKTPFLCAVNIIFESLNAKLHGKCNLVLNQEAVGSLSPSLRRKQHEYLQAADDLERGKQFVRIMPICWTWADSLGRAKDSAARMRRLWENNGYLMQQDRHIAKPLFISALPFGLYSQGKNLQSLNRDFIAPVSSVVPTLPIQGDFAGGRPVLPFFGRKGQLAGLDFFDPRASNQNAFCCAASGKGKSFLVNYLAFNYYANGAKVRIMDIGGSYKKMATMLGARYLDFHPDANINLNPFTHIQDFDDELKSVAAVFGQMAYSHSDTEQPDDTEMNLIRNACRWAWQQQGNNADSDTVYEFFTRFPKVDGAGLADVGDNPALAEAARKLAFNIREFTSHGTYRKIFTGPSNFDIHNDEFVVLELEHLKPQPDLYRVVTLLAINAITQDLYLGDRSRPSFVIFDEAHLFLDKAAMMSQMIGEGYRRARKYGGSFFIITQSIIDLENFGAVGDVIQGNSDFKILLESPHFAKAKKRGLIDYDGFVMELLESLKSLPPKYSEIFVDTPFGAGVLRLAVNDYTYYLYTSKADEIAEIEGLVTSGMSYDEAIWEMVRRHRTS